MLGKARGSLPFFAKRSKGSFEQSLPIYGLPRAEVKGLPRLSGGKEANSPNSSYLIKCLSSGISGSGISGRHLWGHTLRLHKSQGVSPSCSVRPTNQNSQNGATFE